MAYGAKSPRQARRMRSNPGRSNSPRPVNRPMQSNRRSPLQGGGRSSVRPLRSGGPTRGNRMSRGNAISRPGAGTGAGVRSERPKWWWDRMRRRKGMKPSKFTY